MDPLFLHECISHISYQVNNELNKKITNFKNKENTFQMRDLIKLRNIFLLRIFTL
jgi:hypothetical protein